MTIPEIIEAINSLPEGRGIYYDTSSPDDYEPSEKTAGVSTTDLKALAKRYTELNGYLDRIGAALKELGPHYSFQSEVLDILQDWRSKHAARLN